MLSFLFFSSWHNTDDNSSNPLACNTSAYFFGNSDGNNFSFRSDNNDITGIITTSNSKGDDRLVDRTDTCLYSDDDDGNDFIFGDDGEDMLSGGDGNDFIFGGDGEDIISGGDGNDFIFGDDGEDMLSGGDGSDIINYDDDEDQLVDRTDTFLYSDDDDGNDFIFGGDGEDQLSPTSFLRPLSRKSIETKVMNIVMKGFTAILPYAYKEQVVELIQNTPSQERYAVAFDCLIGGTVYSLRKLFLTPLSLFYCQLAAFCDQDRPPTNARSIVTKLDFRG